MYVKLEGDTPTEWPLAVQRIRFENKNVSFPENMSNFDVTSYGFAPFSYADKPDHDVEYQNCLEIAPVLSDGVYLQTWQITDKYTSDERTAYDTQKESDRIDELSSNNRTKRNGLLAETDYFALTDVTMDAAMTTYRQALRDITAHSDWPNLADDDWPTKP